MILKEKQDLILLIYQIVAEINVIKHMVINGFIKTNIWRHVFEARKHLHNKPRSCIHIYGHY